MRHEAAGITTAAFPKTIRLGGVDCAATYLHEPGNAHDGVTVTLPLFALNAASEDRCEWLVPGMLKDKVVAPRQDAAAAAALAPRAAARLRRPRSSPTPRSAKVSLLDALVAHAARRTGLPLQTRRLQARAARVASAHERPRRRRARPPARRIAPPRRAEGGARRARRARHSRRSRRCVCRRRRRAMPRRRARRRCGRPVPPRATAHALASPPSAAESLARASLHRLDSSASCPS